MKDKKESKAEVNLTVCKRFLIANGLRASHDAHVAFQSAIGKMAEGFALRISEAVKAKDKKTITAEDVNEVN